MKVLKRMGAALAALLALAVVLTGTALAAEPGDGGISVQLNGAPVAFTDAAPESTDGRTFVPLRAVMDAMNAQVDYDSQTGTVAIHRGGVDLSMVLGQNSASVTEDGQTRTMTMDVTPYVKEGRTYVPVRFVAEAFRCNVGWDSDSKTVIIVDVDALLGDATFELMDNFSAYCAKEEKNMALDGTLSLDMAGAALPEPVSAKGSLSGVTSGKGAQLNWKLEMSGLSELLGTALPNLEGELRMDLEKPTLYLTLPAALTGGQQDTWYSLDLGAYQTELLGTLDMTKLMQMDEDSGIREVLAAILQSMPLNDSQASYAALAQVTAVYTDMLSDQAFTQKGNTYVAQMKLEGVVDVTVTLTKNGNDIVSADMKMSCDVEEDGSKVTMTMDEYASPDKVTVAMRMEVNAGGTSFKLDLDMTGVSTNKTPVTTLPAGVQAVPMN